VSAGVEIRALERSDLWRIGEIDRTEHIDMIFEQQGEELIARPGDWSSPAWDPSGHDGHSVDGQRRALEHYADAGGIGCGAFSGGRLVGIGVVVPHIRPAIAQLAYLHVTLEFRGTGVGIRLCEELEQIARDAGDTEIVVSATPSENTVRFYTARGFRPMPEPMPELLRLEPDDIHMSKLLRPTFP